MWNTAVESLVFSSGNVCGLSKRLKTCRCTRRGAELSWDDVDSEGAEKFVGRP